MSLSWNGCATLGQQFRLCTSRHIWFLHDISVKTWSDYANFGVDDRPNALDAPGVAQAINKTASAKQNLQQDCLYREASQNLNLLQFHSGRSCGELRVQIIWYTAESKTFTLFLFEVFPTQIVLPSVETTTLDIGSGSGS